jgi:hypothetical protein
LRWIFPKINRVKFVFLGGTRSIPVLSTLLPAPVLTDLSKDGRVSRL